MPFAAMVDHLFAPDGVKHTDPEAIAALENLLYPAADTAVIKPLTVCQGTPSWHWHRLYAITGNFHNDTPQ